MSDKNDQFLREEARRLATDMLRFPTLGIEYRDVIVDAYEDSNSQEKVIQWMRSAGYKTRPDLLHEELIGARRTNLAAWEGVYLLVVQGVGLVTLEIDVAGVRVGGGSPADVTFADGSLRFGASATSPWSGELRFTAVEPDASRPLSDGGVFQKKCVGKLWTKDAAKPEADNSEGATMRCELAPSPDEAPVHNMMMLGAEPLATNPVPASWKSFLKKWTGAYKVTLITSTTDPVTKLRSSETIQSGPEYGIGGEKDSAAMLTYIAPTKVDLSTKDNRPQENRVSYSDGQHQFDLTFADFSEGVRAFSGKIYLQGSTAPADPNAAGTAAALAPASPEWSGTAIAGFVVSAIGLVATLAGFVAVYVSIKYADKLSADRALADARGRNLSEAEITQLANRASDMEIALGELPDHTTASGEGVLNIVSKSPEAKVRARVEMQKEQKRRVQVIDGELQALKTEIAQLELAETAARQERRDALARIQEIKDTDPGKRHEDWEREIREANERITDAEGLERRQREAREKKVEQHAAKGIQLDTLKTGEQHAARFGGK
jgi:hypothetical protein